MTRLIDSDGFPFQFLSELGRRESWRKEIHRPIYHVHKWWAKRLGSVFRGILLGCVLPDGADLQDEFYRVHDLSHSVLDPFMGSGTTVGEAHKLGMTALGRDINPVAVRSVRVALGPLDRAMLLRSLSLLSSSVGERIRYLYRSVDSAGQACDVLYHFWVMKAPCPNCGRSTLLLPSRIIAANAYPRRRPETRVLCPGCRAVFTGDGRAKCATCPDCSLSFDPHVGNVSGRLATCQCGTRFEVLKAIGGRRPDFDLIAKLVLAQDGRKEYLAATEQDRQDYAECTRVLHEEEAAGRIQLPSLELEDGYNTRQAINYGFRKWRDLFNDRQLLALGWLQDAISKLPAPDSREPMLTLFSGTLEFNNMFASYKGEGTGAVRHMFSHHILKPERVPIEANLWGTAKSSGSFSGLFRGRLLRALDYRQSPVEIGDATTGSSRICSRPISGRVLEWPNGETFERRGVYLSCGDSSTSGLPDRSVDLVVTDPPFFDNVHYSELADFFHAWQQLTSTVPQEASTRSGGEVQDADGHGFTRKLAAVLAECHRVLVNDGLLVFTYHHSRPEGWTSVADAVLDAGFVVVNAHPVRAEMSVATPKTQAKEPIQLDVVLVCRKRTTAVLVRPSVGEALSRAFKKAERLRGAGFDLSVNDLRVILFGQLLTTVESASDTEKLGSVVVQELERAATVEQRVGPRPAGASSEHGASGGQLALDFQDA